MTFLIFKIIIPVFIIIGSLYWFIQLFFTFKVIKKIVLLHNINYNNITAWPRVSIIVPARNEAITIEPAVKSRLQDDYPNFEILLIDDRSTDGTSEIIDKIATTDKRVKAIHIKELPYGWIGKLYAMNEGVKNATGDWFLFSDADVHVKPETLKKAIAYSETRKLDHLVVLPEIKGTNLLLESAISLFIKMIVTFGRMWEVENEKSNAALGVGAFNLVKRTAYEKSGGFEYLKGEIADDVSLGYFLKKSKAKTAIVNGRDYVSVVFYRSLKDMAVGTERATFTSLGNFSFARTTIICLIFFLLEIFPVFLFIPLGIPYLYFWGIIMTLIALIVSVKTNKWINRSSLPSFLFPVAAFVFSFMGIRAGYLGAKRGGVYWRDTFYSTEELKKGKRLNIL